MDYHQYQQGDWITFFHASHWNKFKQEYGLWVKGKIFIRRGTSIIVRRLEALNGQELGISGGGYNLKDIEIMDNQTCEIGEVTKCQ